MKNIINYIKKNYLFLSILGILILFCFLNFFNIKNYFNSLGLIGTKYYIAYFCVSLLLFIIFIFYKKKLYKTNENIENNIHKIFLKLGIILGIFFLVLSPMFTGSDEHNHFYRIYEITDLKFVTPTDEFIGSNMPGSLHETFIVGGEHNTKINYLNIIDMIDIELDKNNTEEYGNLWTNSYHNTALYSPVSYTPHTVGVAIGKVLDLAPYYIGMLGRLTNLIIFLIIGYFTLKIMPKAKIFFFLILISPNMLQTATTLSADAFTNIIFLFFLAMIFKNIFQKDIISVKDKILLFISAIVISLCKVVYFPIIALLFLIPKDKFNNNLKSKNIFVVFTIILSLVGALLWSSATQGVFEIEYTMTEHQMNFVFSNFIEYIFIFIRTMSINIVNYIESLFVGRTMYHSQLAIPAIVSFGYIALVILSLFISTDNNKTKRSFNILIWCISLLIIGLISSAIYVQCTAQYFSVGDPLIIGIQGRYFLPVIFLIPFMVINLKKKLKFDSKNLILTAVSINMITYFYMMMTFIV